MWDSLRDIALPIRHNVPDKESPVKTDTPHRFVQKSIDLLEVGAEITDTVIDDYAISVVQSNTGLKKSLGDRFAKLIGAPNTVLAVDDEMVIECQAAALDPTKYLALLQLLLSLWNQFRNPAAD